MPKGFFNGISRKKYDDLYHSGRTKVIGGATRLYSRSIPKIWNGWVTPTARLLMLVRFSLLVALVLGFVLIANPQAQEVMRALAESSGYGRKIWFVISALICAFVAWYWARVAFFFSYEEIAATQRRFTNKRLSELNLEEDETKRIQRWLNGIKEYLPRFLGAAVLAVIAVGMYGAADPYPPGFVGPRAMLSIGAIGFAVGAVAFYFLCPTLRRLVRLCDDDRLDGSNSIDQILSRTWPFFLLGIGFTVGLTTLFTYYAVAVAPSLGTATIGLLFAIALIPNGTFLVLYFGERWGIPVIGFAVLWLIAISFIVDNHRVRQYPGMASYGAFKPEPSDPVAYAEFSTFEDYYDEWIGGLEAEYAEGSPIPVFIVSAEGGGIRAAYWTALVLSELQDRSEQLGLGARNFARHVFAVSGVSGGSLGAATFAGLLAARAEGPPEAQPGDATETRQDGLTLTAQPLGDESSLARQADCVLFHDFLAPTVAVMLFPDFFQRFYIFSQFNDRAVALERAWESSWDRCVSDRPLFSRPFGELWQGANPYGVPLLFLNSTVVETGQRMISSPLPLNPDYFEHVFSDAIETNRVLGHQAPLSTVVGTSARFTYVSPAGTVRRLDLAGDASEEDLLIRVVDGGYFENSGAVTASELLSALEVVAEQRSYRRVTANERIQSIRPIIIHISNDPLREGEAESLLEARAGGILPELLSPVEALLNSRPARGYQARTSLANRVLGNRLPDAQTVQVPQPVIDPGLHVHFRLCEYDTPLPLGWVLSDKTRNELYAQLTGAPVNGDPSVSRGIAEHNTALLDRILNTLEGIEGAASEMPVVVNSYEDCHGRPGAVEQAMADQPEASGGPVMEDP